MTTYRRLDLERLDGSGSLVFCAPSLQVDGAQPGMILTIEDTPGSFISPGRYRILDIGPEQASALIGGS